MTASRPYYDAPDPPDPMLDAVYDSVAVLLEHPELETGLLEVAGLVTRSLVGADGAGVALMSGQDLLLRVASSALVDRADAVQYGLGEGPCLAAVAEGRPIRTDFLNEHASRWPRFGPAVEELGIASMLSLPLRVRTEVIGSMNVYALRGDGFSPLDTENGERFALPVAAAIRSSQANRRVDRLAEEMRETLEAKAAVSAAVALIGDRDRVARKVALQSLSDLAAQRHESLLAAAAELLAAEPDETGTPSPEPSDGTP